MLTIEAPRTNKILNYFHHMGEEEVFTFTNEHGKPDLAKAREFAESMRHQFGPLLDVTVKVEQRVNRVTISRLTAA